MTVGVDVFYRTKGKHPKVEVLVAGANVVQWQTLALGSEQPKAQWQESQSLFPASSDPLAIAQAADTTLEAIRLATLIYNDLVIFPLSPISGVRHRLAAKLAEVYEFSLIFEVDFAFWILVMGGVGQSRGLPTSHIFRRQVNGHGQGNLG